MRHPIRMLDLVRLHAPLAKDLRLAFEQVLGSGGFILGRTVEEFEVRLSEYVGCEQSIGVSSGTDALLAAMMALNVGPGDEVITSSYSFFATAGAIARLGAVPVFVDIDPVTFNIAPEQIEQLVGPRTVGIIPVHLFGQCAEMKQILKIARDKGLWVLEDAAQAIGAEYKGQSAGTIGTAGTFSFFPAKNLGALGDGGAVVTSDSKLASNLRSIRQHGSTTKYLHQVVGGNFRLDALQAAFLEVKLPHLVGWEEGRRRIAARYHERLSRMSGLILPKEIEDRRHVYNQFVVRFDSEKRRDRAVTELKSREIGCAVYYPIPLHLQPCFAELGYKKGQLPHAEAASVCSLALPVDPNLGDLDFERICEAVYEC